MHSVYIGTVVACCTAALIVVTKSIRVLRRPWDLVHETGIHVKLGDVTVSVTEMKEAIKRMKSGKATGADDIASEFREAKSWYPAMSDWPSDWQESTTVPISKKKGSQVECLN